VKLDPDRDEVLRDVPSGGGRALDLGCGEGELASLLAARGLRVVALDRHAPSLARAAGDPRVACVRGDACATPLPGGTFDLVALVRVLHHLPLERALPEIVRLLKPGGIVVVVGLYRLRTLTDYAWGVSGKLARLLRGGVPRAERSQAPWAEVHDDLATIRRKLAAALPGVRIERTLFIRYRAVWRKPSSP
jgi:SAM-dependent methyltransferase